MGAALHNKAVVLVFPEQIEQMMLFISIINIKLYFLELALQYISTLWCSHNSLGCQLLRSCTNSETKYPCLQTSTTKYSGSSKSHSYRECTRLPTADYVTEKAPFFGNSGSIHVQQKGWFQSFICSMVPVIWFIRGRDLLEKYKQ